MASPSVAPSAASGSSAPSADAGAPVTAGPLDNTQSNIQLSFQNIHFYRDSIGGLWFFGEVTNTGSTPVADIGFYLNLYSQSGDRTARSSVLKVSNVVMQPGDTSVWDTDMSDNPAQWAKVEIQYAEQVGARDEAQRVYTDWDTSDVKLGPAANGGTEPFVTGKVSNTGPLATKIDNIVVALYAADGTLQFVNEDGVLSPGDPTRTIAPGESADFAADLVSYTGAGGPPARIEVTVQAQKPQP